MRLRFEVFKSELPEDLEMFIIVWLLNITGIN